MKKREVYKVPSRNNGCFAKQLFFKFSECEEYLSDKPNFTPHCEITTVKD